MNISVVHTMNKPIEITPSLFYKYAKSPHWLWLDLYGDQSEKSDVPELAKKLIEEGVLHEEEYIRGIDLIDVDPDLDEAEAEKQTLELMHQGVNTIYQGVISCSKDGVIFKGRPDLLEKCSGKSKFGDYYYIPVEIKNSTKCDKLSYKKQVMFYAFILNSIQGHMPESGGFINRNKEKLKCPLTDKLLGQTNEAVADILQIISGKEPPLSIKSATKETPWFDFLFNYAKEKNDIALIYKVSDASLDSLRKANIITISDLANCDIDALPKIKGASETTLVKAKEQAKSLLEGKIKKLSTPKIPDSEVRIYFDIEGDPLLKVEYMFGFLVEESASEPFFKYFLAVSPEDEYKMWGDFLAWIKKVSYQNYKVFHYHHYEKTALKKLSERYGGAELLVNFQKNMVDLSPLAISSFIFPVYFYSIKDIAKHLGFNWQHAKAGGAQSIFWYEQWLETGDRSVLQDIINYNEDDVRATKFLHDWLVANKDKLFD